MLASDHFAGLPPEQNAVTSVVQVMALHFPVLQSGAAILDVVLAAPSLIPPIKTTLISIWSDRQYWGVLLWIDRDKPSQSKTQDLLFFKQEEHLCYVSTKAVLLALKSSLICTWLLENMFCFAIGHHRENVFSWTLLSRCVLDTRGPNSLTPIELSKMIDCPLVP